MELRQLAYLVAVVEHGGFTAAAEELHVAQPGVSAQVRRLEAELGHELLDRSGRRVRPTAVGEALLPHARAALAAVGALREEVDALAGLLRGRVAVGLVPGGPAGFVSDLLGRFAAAHPAVEATLTEADSERLLALLLDGRLDLVVAGRAAPPPAGVATATLLEEPLAAAVAAGHPLAARAASPRAGVGRGRGARLARGAGGGAADLPPPRQRPARRLRRRLRGGGVRPRIAFEAGDPNVLVQLARRGLGVAILPRIVASGADGLVALALGPPELRARMELLWRADGPVESRRSGACHAGARGRRRRPPARSRADPARRPRPDDGEAPARDDGPGDRPADRPSAAAESRAG